MNAPLNSDFAAGVLGFGVKSAEPDTPVHDAFALTGTKGQARIVLDEKVYTLRITRAGKLILTK